jgi:dihydrofolate reductase
MDAAMKGDGAMRNVVAVEYVSLDGVMEDPSWTAPYWNDELAQYQYDQLFASDALLLGRVTYQGFAAAWPAMTDERGFADRMNNLPKYVASTTLDKAEWNASLIKENVPDVVAKLKHGSGQDILIYGSAALVNTLIQHRLIDVYRLMVHPVVLGSGKRLFNDGVRADLRLIDSRTTSTGVALLSYEPSRDR